MTTSTRNGVEAVDHAITSRRSVRRFLSDPVPRHVVAEILQVAARSPSGTNAQPWEVSVFVGESLRRLVDSLLAVHYDKRNGAVHLAELQPYPDEWKSPFIDRRRKLGWDLYGLLG
ncbi:nitroreductase family protein, partial [Pseudomonas aeruginosa]|uniref:nitroreductase family protein n=1 Tax=Pseudomonas aeruginosa TaxID=287 RepID=UPI0015BD4502